MQKQKYVFLIWFHWQVNWAVNILGVLLLLPEAPLDFYGNGVSPLTSGQTTQTHSRHSIYTAPNTFTEQLQIQPFHVLSAYEVMKRFRIRKWHTNYLWKWFPHYWQLHPNHPEGLVKNSDSETEPSQSPEGTAWAYKLNKIPRQSWHVAKLGIYGKNPESRSLDGIQKGFLCRLIRGPPLQRLNVHLST